jgi:DNA-binding MarR family transcriptional regulator
MPNTSPSTSTDSSEFQLLNEVGMLDQLAQSEAAKLLAPDLNMPQFIVLNHLQWRGVEISMASLANAIQVTKGAMSNTVSRLQQKDWVCVRPDPSDGRGKLVSITKSGIDARDGAVIRLDAGLVGLDTVLSPKEMAKALQLIKKVRVWFDKKRG